MSHRHEEPKGRRDINPAAVQFFVKVTRDIAIFILGGVAFVHELTSSTTERPQILIMSAAMMGLPLIIRGDEKRGEAKANDTPPANNSPPES